MCKNGQRWYPNVIPDLFPQLKRICVSLKYDTSATSLTGRSSGFGNTSAFRHYGTSALLRINDKGQLVGKHLDFFGSTDWLRLGMHLPRRFRFNQSLPVVEETELGVDFCLTWSTDPR